MKNLKEAIQEAIKKAKLVIKEVNDKIKDYESTFKVIESFPDNKRLACYLYYFSFANSSFSINYKDFEWLLDIIKNEEIWSKVRGKNDFSMNYSQYLEKANKILDLGITFDQALSVIENYRDKGGRI